MKEHNHILLRSLLGVVLAWLCCGVTGMSQFSAQALPPPVGAGIVATLQADQDIYTNQPARVWCPPCRTNDPPCMLPCYLIEPQTAVGRFTFTVRNNYNLPRTFEFASGQQFDLELIDQAGGVVAAWSDDKSFFQMMTSFTLAPGEAAVFIADLPLKDRAGQQLYGIYQARALLTTRDPQPRVAANIPIGVMLAP